MSDRNFGAQSTYSLSSKKPDFVSSRKSSALRSKKSCQKSRVLIDTKARRSTDGVETQSKITVEKLQDFNAAQTFENPIDDVQPTVALDETVNVEENQFENALPAQNEELKDEVASLV